jgi:hypothetical protein
MNLDSLARFGEFIAGVGVIVTLAYLAVQMRQNTQSVRANTNQRVADATVSITQSVYTSADVAQFFHKAAFTPAELSDLEKFRWHAMMTGIIRHFENMFVQKKLGTMDADVWMGMEQSIRQWCSLPGFVDWLAQNRGRLSSRLDAWLVEQKILPPWTGDTGDPL